MGKQRRKREKLHKKNPTGLLSVKDFDEVEGVTQEEKERALLNIYDEMQSDNIEEKLSALQTLETMAWDTVMAEHIAKDGIVKIAGPLLLHSNATIRAAATSTLRQIADRGEVNALNTLIKDDIMTPLSLLLEKHYSDWTYKSDHKDAKDEKEAYIQAVTLLWTLCENNETAIKCVNQQNLVPILTKYLNIDSYDMCISVITMQCLITMTEDNTDATMKIQPNIEILQNIITKTITEGADSKQAEIRFLKIASFALLNNISRLDVCKPIYLNVFIKTLDEVLSVDNKQLLSSLVSILPHEKNATSSSKRKKVTESKMVLSTQLLTLETLTNLSSSDDDEDDESVDVDDSEEMDVDSVPMDVDNASENLRRPFPVELVEAFNHCNFISKIWEKTVAVDRDSQEILGQTAEGKSVLNQFYILRCRAYLCLNNLLPNFDIDTLGGIEYLYSKWLEVGKVVVENITPSDMELLDAVVYIARAIVDRLSYIQADVFTQLNEATFQLILNNEIQTRNTNDSIRVNMMRMLGSLALNLIRSNNQQSYNMAKQISEIMLNSCMGETQLWILAETIDATMDLFAEDETDYLAFDIELIRRLKPLISTFKNKVRQQKSKLKDQIGVISTVKTNIWRFIKYKEKQLKKFR